MNIPTIQIFENWTHDDSIDQYWIEINYNQFLTYLPDEDIFLLNDEEINKEDAAGLYKTYIIEHTPCSLWENHFFNDKTKINEIRKEKTLSKVYLVNDKKVTERDIVHQYIKKENSKATIEGNKHYLENESKSIEVTKTAYNYYNFLKGLQQNYINATFNL